MNKVDKVTKESRVLIETAKDTVGHDLIQPFRERGLSDEQITSVVKLVNLALDQAYQKAVPAFQNSIKKHL